MYKIFYSWQSDLDSKVTRNFIEDAIKKAIKEINKSYDLEVCIDRDTKNIPGSPEISSTIFEKIKNSHVFIGDVSIINKENQDEKRKTPNPNVLLELGYAAGILSWDNIICICNEAYGKSKELPFDLRNRTIILYSLNSDDIDKNERKKTLICKIKNAIESCILSKLDNKKDDVKETIERHKKIIENRLNRKSQYGYMSLYCYPNKIVKINEERLKCIFALAKKSMSEYGEELYYSKINPIPNGYFANYPENENYLKTYIVTCYFNGFIALDCYINLNFWVDKMQDTEYEFYLTHFTYIIQKHLQLTKEILEGYCDEISLILNFESLDKFFIPEYVGVRVVKKNFCQVFSEPIEQSMKLSEIHGRNKWNCIIPKVIDILNQIVRIFGLSKIPQNYWDDKEILNHAKQLPM